VKQSEHGKQFVHSFESCKLEAYFDSGRVATIGYGHIRGVKMGDTCTQAQADAWYDEDTDEAEAAVNDLVKVPLSQNQFDALVSFTFNCGIAALRNSTLLRLLNAGDYDGARDQFGRWNHDNGVVVAGLTRRRAAEANLFLYRG
jgi:lysozyme